MNNFGNGLGFFKNRIRNFGLEVWILSLYLDLGRLLLVRLGGYTVNLCTFYFYKVIGKLTAFLQPQEFSVRNITVTSSTITTQSSHDSSNRKWVTSSINLLHYGSLWISTVAPVVSRSHTHPSHSQTSRLLTSSLFLGVPVPHVTQCMRDVWIPQFYLLVFHHTETHIKVFSIAFALSINNKQKRLTIEQSTSPRST